MEMAEDSVTDIFEEVSVIVTFYVHMVSTSPRTIRIMMTLFKFVYSVIFAARYWGKIL